MSKSEEHIEPKVTYRARAESIPAEYFEAYAALYAKVRHVLFKLMQQDGYNENLVLKIFSRKYGLNSRQLSSIVVGVKGEIAAARELRKNHIDEVTQSVKALTAAVKKLEKQRKGVKKKIAGQKNVVKLVELAFELEKILFSLHHKKRRLYSQTDKLAKLRANKLKRCFGTKKLFAKQNRLDENDYLNHAEWKEDWQKARTSYFDIVGRGAETYGNSCAQFSPVAQQDGTVQHDLRLRVAPAFEEQFGQYTTIENVTLLNKAAEADVAYAIEHHKPIMIKVCRGKGDHWTFRITVSRRPIERVSSSFNGYVGIDINVGSIDAALIDHQGNLKTIKSIPYKTSCNANANQIADSIGCGVKEIIALCTKHKVPIVHEDLDFHKKKQAMRDSALPNRKALSQFSYAKIINTVESRAQREGIEVIKVNPAFSSWIGLVNYMSQYGLNSGTAAAIVIARRADRFSERYPLSYACTLSLPEDKEGHVWCSWANLARTIHALNKKQVYIRRHDWFGSGANCTAVATLMSNSTSALSSPSGEDSTNRRETRSPDVHGPPT
jgi:IS605 OrfB family transposase